MTKIEELAAKVARLEARVASLENHGIRSNTEPPTPPPNGALTGKIDRWYWGNKPNLQRELIAALTDHYRTLAQGDNLTRGITFDGAHTVELADLPRVIAATVTRERQARQELEAAEIGRRTYGDDHNVNRIQRLKVDLAARERHTKDLLDTTTLPSMPPALASKVKALRQPPLANPWS